MLTSRRNPGLYASIANSPARSAPARQRTDLVHRRNRPHWSERVPVENIGAVTRGRPKPRYSRQLIDETIEVWQPYYDTKLTDEDAREIIENVAGFFGALMGWRHDLRNRADPE